MFDSAKAAVVYVIVSLVLFGTLQANWSESFDGDELDLATWQFFPFPDVTKTFTSTIEVDPNGNKYLIFDETSSTGKGGSAFGAGFGTDEVFTDVRLGAVVNVTGDASHNHHGLLARTVYVVDPDGSVTGVAPGLFAPQTYVMHVNWERGPANLKIDIEKVVNMQNIMRNEEALGLEVSVPGLNHARSYYAELDVVGSGPVYVTGSLYEYKGGPLVMKTATMVDTNGNDPWEDPDAHDEVFVNGQSGIFAQNENSEPAGYHCTFDDVFSSSDGPAAVNPSPADGAVDVSIDADLSWLEAKFATSREVWFGKKRSMEKIEQSPDGTSFDPGTLEFGRTYQWRIDQIGPSGVVAGRTWTFTAADYIIAEDFGTYTDHADLMAVWVDNIADFDYVFLAVDSVGNKSMRIDSQNQFEPFYTQATRTFESPQDWTVHGVEAMSLSFVGEHENFEHLMYLIIEDAAGQSFRIEHPYTYAVQSDTWRKWTFTLGRFADAGVDLGSVKKLTIGFGNGTATAQEGDDRDFVYIDDIHLCPAGSYEIQ
ncbi:MAG: hypothetical protein JW837_03770 [Sedimentisphaerales bacterium]|nr:hypothetical protein [Sedimentisphaerales bacterium]